MIGSTEVQNKDRVARNEYRKVLRRYYFRELILKCNSYTYSIGGGKFNSKSKEFNSGGVIADETIADSRTLTVALSEAIASASKRPAGVSMTLCAPACISRA